MQRILAAWHLPGPLRRAVLAYVQWVIGAPLDRIAPTETIRRVACPVLLIHGDNDTRVPPGDAEAVYANRPGEHVRLLRIAGADHCAVESLLCWVDAITQFLEHSLRGNAHSRRLIQDNE